MILSSFPCSSCRCLSCSARSDLSSLSSVITVEMMSVITFRRLHVFCPHLSRLVCIAFSLVRSFAFRKVVAVFILDRDLIEGYHQVMVIITVSSNEKYGTRVIQFCRKISLNRNRDDTSSSIEHDLFTNELLVSRTEYFGVRAISPSIES